MNSLTRNNSRSTPSRSALVPGPGVGDQPEASTSLKSFIERQDGLPGAKCSRRREESSEAAVVDPVMIGVGAVARGTVTAYPEDSAKRGPARTRSFRRTSSTRQLLQSQTLHRAMNSKAQLREEKATVKEPAIRERKRMSITARDFADLIAVPKGEAAPEDGPVKLSYDIPRVVAEMTAMNVLPPSFAHKAGVQVQGIPKRPVQDGQPEQIAVTGSIHRSKPTTLPPTDAAPAKNHERARRRTSSGFHPKENDGSLQIRRASSDVGTNETEWEQPSVRRTVSLDDKHLEVMNVQVLRRRSSLHSGREERTNPIRGVESGSDHHRPPRPTTQGTRPSYRDAPFAIPTGSDRSSQRSESITSRADDVHTLEFLASFSEFSELTDEWEPHSIRRAKSLDDQKIQAASEHLYRARSLSEDLTSRTEQSSGVYSDASRTHSRPPRQPGPNIRGYSPSTPSSSDGSAGQSALHFSVHQRGVPRRTSSSLHRNRQLQKSSSQSPAA